MRSSLPRRYVQPINLSNTFSTTTVVVSSTQSQRVLRNCSEVRTNCPHRHVESPIHPNVGDIEYTLSFHLKMVRKLFVPILLAAAICTPACGFSPHSTVSRTRLDLQFSQTKESKVEVDESVRTLPPVIQQIADERREFQMNLGKAMDTLRKDMPYILKRSPGKGFYSLETKANID